MVETNLIVMFLRNIIVLPYNEVRLEISSEYDKKILGLSELNNDGYLLLTNLLDPLEEKPNISDLPTIAVLGKIKSKIELPNGIVRTVIAGIDRVEVLNYIENDNGMVSAFVISTKDYDYDEKEAEALKRIMLKDLNNYINISPYMTNNVMGRIDGISSLSKLSDIVVSELALSYEEKIKYVSVPNPINRLRMIIKDLNKELETIKLEQNIELALKSKLDESQREYVLREKLKLIKEELGEVDFKDQDVKTFKSKIEVLEAPTKVKKKLKDEVNRYEIMSDSSPETSIVRNYIETLLSLPWSNSTIDNSDIIGVKKFLDDSHFGLDQVKIRILEFLAVRQHTSNTNSPIICLVGPPGVGKTSLAKSIAKAINKKFVKISVGGVTDEAEIVGHRRTYIGAMPGKIMQGIIKAGSNNPVFLIDEIDKIRSDYRGDPASSLLDVLDKEQNNMFCDNYIEEEFDLSQVMFILTANTTDTIPSALKDRLEIIELSSYTIFEKMEISKNYLIPKLLLMHNIANDKVIFTDKAIEKIILSYTKESGVRELERQLASICRRIVIDMFEDGKKKNYLIDEDKVVDILGKEKYVSLINERNMKAGVVNALAYTPNGGIVLKVTVVKYKGKGNFKLTGMLGNVMKESVYIALSYIKSNASRLGIHYDDIITNDLHIHFEEGAINKEGPSAGVAITTAIISLFKKVHVTNTISMTGEMTLRGKVLPVGGIKEKLIAASVNNIKKVYIPKENLRDLSDVPTYVKDNLEIVLIDNYIEVFNDLFKKQ